MIVATAGHVDHGKTRLVKALTGVDTDRLPDEKRRGMSIDLGFAYRDLGSGVSLGFVDVPGHERYLRNMLAGVVGIDAALLVVAADDGPMPQTREHLAVLDLLGVTRGWIAITKIDRVDKGRVAEVRSMIERLIDGTSLGGAPIFAVSTASGTGIESLLAALRADAQSHIPQDDDAPFRLAIDRSFTVSGAGLVVTGYVHAGRVRIGDRLVVEPPGASVRVRGIHAQNRQTDVGRRGERCAINVGGTSLKADDVRRGAWLLSPAAHAPARRLDASIVAPIDSHVLSIRHWIPAHAYLAAADVPCRVAVIGAPEGPRQRRLVQLVLDRPVVAKRGDRFILRDQSARRVIAGGTVLDPFAPGRGRAAPARKAVLQALQDPDAAAALRAVAAVSPHGVDLDQFVRGNDLPPDAARRLAAACDLLTTEGPACVWGFAHAHWDRFAAEIVAAVEAWHDANPSDLGPDNDALARALKGRPDPATVAAAARRLADTGTLAQRGTVNHLPSHRPVPPPEERAQFAPILALLEADRRRPRRVREIADRVGIALPTLGRMFQQAVRRGWIYPVAANRYYGRAGLLELARECEMISRQDDENRIDIATAREAFGIGRNLTVQVLEFFDVAGFTQRRGARRTILRSAEQIFGPDDGAKTEDTTTITEGNRTPVGRPDFKSGEAR